MHKNKDFGIVSLHSSDWKVIHENFSSGSRVLSVLQFLHQVREASCFQQGALGARNKQRRGQELPHLGEWCGADMGLGVALHSYSTG